MPPQRCHELYKATLQPPRARTMSCMISFLRPRKQGRTKRPRGHASPVEARKRVINAWTWWMFSSIHSTVLP